MSTDGTINRLDLPDPPPDGRYTRVVPTRIGRRALLKGLAGGVALLAAPARAAAPDLRTLASAFRRLPTDAALDHAARALAAGATAEDVLGAVFLAGVEDIRPLPVGLSSTR